MAIYKVCNDGPFLGLLLHSVQSFGTQPVAQAGKMWSRARFSSRGAAPLRFMSGLASDMQVVTRVIRLWRCVIPFLSESQRAFFNSPEGRAKIGDAKVEEFNKASVGLKLPKHVKDTPKDRSARVQKHFKNNKEQIIGH